MPNTTPTPAEVREGVVREYIVLALIEAGSMYRDGAESFLAEYDAARAAAVRAAAIREAADALEAQSCTCGCRRAVEFLKTLADTAAAPITTPTPQEH